MAEIANAFATLFTWVGIVCVCGMGCGTFLVYTDKVTLEELKKTFVKEKDKWGR